MSPHINEGFLEAVTIRDHRESQEKGTGHHRVFSWGRGVPRGSIIDPLLFTHLNHVLVCHSPKRFLLCNNVMGQSVFITHLF